MRIEGIAGIEGIEGIEGAHVEVTLAVGNPYLSTFIGAKLVSWVFASPPLSAEE